MEDKAKQKYVAELKKYHAKLTQAIRQNYQIDTEYLETLAWGYNTTAFYIKSTENKEYLLKLANWSKEKEAGIIKDIELSDKFRAVIPTPVYIKNLSGDYLCRFEDKVLRLSHYVSGVAPLDLNYDILGQMVAVLRSMHNFTTEQKHTNPNISVNTKASDEVILHGDLTPHNVLVSYGKLVAVMDFELSFVGQKEYDLARTAFFSWNYFATQSFDQIADFVITNYCDNRINKDLFYSLAVENAKKHLTSVEKHKADYYRQEDWERDYDFAKNQLTTLIASLQEVLPKIR